MFFFGARTRCWTMCLGILTLPGVEFAASLRRLGCIVGPLIFNGVIYFKAGSVGRSFCFAEAGWPSFAFNSRAFASASCATLRYAPKSENQNLFERRYIQ